MDRPPRLPVFEPELTDADARAVADAIRDASISGTSERVSRFERAYAERLGVPHAVAVTNGTAALELSVAALGLGPGDEVLCPAMTIISCARAIVLASATPVLVDVTPDTYCLDPEDIARKITPRTRAILAVHAFGHPYDAERIGALAARHGLHVIEDAAQAHGATCRVGDAFLECGSLGDVSTLSFYANKPVTTGEGGLVLTRKEDVATRVRALANLYLGGPRRFFHEELGHNHRLSGILASLGIEQLSRLDETVRKKRELAARYEKALEDVPHVQLQKKAPWANPIHWMNTVVLRDAAPLDAAGLAEALGRRGIETRPFFVGLHEQPALRNRGLFAGERYPVTERLSKRGLYLPSGVSLGEREVARVSDEVRRALAEARPAAAVVPVALDPVDVAEDARIFGAGFAEAYDALYADKDYGADVDTLVTCFERFGQTPVRAVLDLGAGTGRHAAELSRRGYAVTGVDQSADMLAIAKRRNPNGRFLTSDLRTVDLAETFDAVVVLFAVLSYQTTTAGILETLRNVRRHLRPNGLFIADVWFGAGDGRPPSQTRREGARDGVTFVRTGMLSRDALAQRVDLAYTLTRTENGASRTFRERHQMHYFMPTELELALDQAGFRLVHLSRERDLEHAPRPSDTTALFVAAAR